MTTNRLKFIKENITQEQLDRFLSKISEPNEKGCREWRGCTDKDGYGRTSFRISKRKYMIKAHRFNLYLTNPTDDESLVACHQPLICHNPKCCEPTHLRWATHSENVRDKFVDGTFFYLHGEKSGKTCKLSTDQITEIRSLSGQITQRQISREFNISNQHVSRIINNKRRQHG